MKTEESPLELTLRSLSMTFHKVVVSVGIWGEDWIVRGRPSFLRLFRGRRETGKLVTRQGGQVEEKRSSRKRQPVSWWA